MKFYVYVDKQDGEVKNHIFVEDLDEFVHFQYDPSRMSFTGVVIDAGNVFAAKQAYDSPESHAEATIAWIPEPDETANYSVTAKTREQLKMLSHMIRCSTIALKIGKSLKECNENLATLAHHIRIYNDTNPDVETEAVFNRLKERYIEYFQRLRYSPHFPGEE